MNYKGTFENYCKTYIAGKTFEKPEQYAQIEWEAKKKYELKAKIMEMDNHLTHEAEIILEQASEDDGDNKLSSEFNIIKEKYLGEFKTKYSD